MYYTLEDLMQNSIFVKPGMLVVWPQYEEEKRLHLDEISQKFHLCYAQNNSTVAFVTSGGEVYATAITEDVIASLEANGFTERHFSVPFSEGDYPKACKKEWDRIQGRAREIREYEFKSHCKHYSDANGIGSLDNSVLRNCFRVPEVGVCVKHVNYESAFYPVISKTLDKVAMSYLGRYSKNNGKVAFVYRDGSTFIAKGYKIIKLLEEAGYTEKAFFVPMSNGEQIVNPDIDRRWQEIKKV